MRYNTIKYNDVANSPGVAISIYLQGCPAPHCKGCFNPETWDFQKGKELTDAIILDIIKRIHENGINRSLCILGGEPLCEENISATVKIIQCAKLTTPQTPIYIWSRFLYEELITRAKKDENLNYILNNIYCLIDGPFIEELKVLNMPMRGSTNQRIIYLNEQT